MRSKTFVVMAGFVVWCGCAAAQTQESSDAKKEDILKLMKLTGSDQMARQILSQMIAAMKPGAPRVPETFWTEFMAEVDTNELMDMLVPVYDKHFTQEEIRQMIEFYETPVGRKIIEAMPQVMQESMALGQIWGQNLGRKVQAKLQQEQQPKQN
jgi:uncharacterized protein